MPGIVDKPHEMVLHEMRQCGVYVRRTCQPSSWPDRDDAIGLLPMAFSILRLYKQYIKESLAFFCGHPLYMVQISMTSFDE